MQLCTTTFRPRYWEHLLNYAKPLQRKIRQPLERVAKSARCKIQMHDLFCRALIWHHQELAVCEKERRWTHHSTGRSRRLVINSWECQWIRCYGFLFSMYILLSGRVTIYILYNKSGETDDDKPVQPVVSNKNESLRQQLGTFVTHLGTYMPF
jgi:hypothetical protein